MTRDTPSTSQGVPPPALISVFALACGITVANLYYVQPLVGPIGESFHLSVGTAALLVTMLQLGYVAGLIFLVPLGDLVENRRLILLTLGGLMLSCVIAALSDRASIFMLCCLLVGFGSAATQMLMPMAAHLAPDQSRGRVLGAVMSGLLVGILLARPFSTLAAGYVGWRGIFVLSAVFGAGLIGILTIMLPRFQPKPGLHYGSLIISLWPLLRDTTVLQRRSFYQACQYGAFSLFWTAIPLVLKEPPFSLGNVGMSLFMLSGVTGAFVAPIAGRLADHGYSRPATAFAFAMVALCFVIAYFGKSSIITLVLAGVVLDAGVQTHIVVGQREIYAVASHMRSRLNAIYLAILFCGGAFGSALSGVSYARGGLPFICLVGFAFPAAATLAFLTEFVRFRK